MPTRAVIHIQNTAPGPPRKMAVATPAMLPVPIVADRDVIKALNGLISPSPPGTRPSHSILKPKGIFRMVNSLSPTVKNSPQPSMSTSMGTPQTMPLSQLTALVIVSMGFLSSSWSSD